MYLMVIRNKIQSGQTFRSAHTTTRNKHLEFLLHLVRNRFEHRRFNETREDCIASNIVSKRINKTSAIKLITRQYNNI